MKSRCRFRDRFGEFFWGHFDLHFGVIMGSFLDPNGFLMILRVRGIQNEVFFGPWGDFLTSENRLGFFVDF